MQVDMIPHVPRKAGSGCHESCSAAAVFWTECKDTIVGVQTAGGCRWAAARGVGLRPRLRFYAAYMNFLRHANKDPMAQKLLRLEFCTAHVALPMPLAAGGETDTSWQVLSILMLIEAASRSPCKDLGFHLACRSDACYMRLSTFYLSPRAMKYRTCA